MHGITPSLYVGNVDDAQRPPKHIGGLLFVAEEFEISPPRRLIFSKIPLKESLRQIPFHSPSDCIQRRSIPNLFVLQMAQRTPLSLVSTSSMLTALIRMAP